MDTNLIPQDRLTLEMLTEILAQMYQHAAEQLETKDKLAADLEQDGEDTSSEVAGSRNTAFEATLASRRSAQLATNTLPVLRHSRVSTHKAEDNSAVISG